MSFIDRLPRDLLKSALLANAAFSTLSAVTFLAAPVPIAAALNLPAAEISSLGVSLGLFAGLLIWLATRDFRAAWPRAVALAVIAGDVLWVVGTLAFVAAWDGVTGAGIAGTVGVAVVVASLADAQALGLLRLRREALPQPA